MAEQSTPSHKKTDSGVDGIVPLPDTFTAAQSLCTAVSFLASEHGFRAIDELVKAAPLRELEIKTKDETIRDLREELLAVKREHELFNDQQLRIFERKYEKWREENVALQHDIDELEAVLEEKDSKSAMLQSELQAVKARVEDFEKEIAHLTTRVKEKTQQLGSLDARLQHAQADLDRRVEEIKEVHNRMSALQESLNNETNQHKVLREEANKNRMRLKEFYQFSVKITELDLKDVTIRMTQLWMVATKLVEKFFGQNLPDDILKSDWTGLRDYDIFKHQLPLPQSNTDAARRMRAAIVLGNLTRLVNRFIFQPNYLLDEESGLRELLRHEASIDTAKERYIRGMLLSMSPKEQEANSEANVHHVAKELLEIANVRVLLTPETFAAFPEALMVFIRQCQELWKIIQRGKQKLEPSFAYSASPDHRWQLFNDTFADAKDGKNSGKQHTTSAVESDIVLIPRIYLVGTNADPDLITHGCVLRKTHLDAAAEEVKNSLSSAPFTQAASSRYRNRQGRTMSVSGNSRPFLA